MHIKKWLIARDRESVIVMDNFYKELSDRTINNVLKFQAENTVKCEKCGSDKITEISYGLPGWVDIGVEIDPRIELMLKERRIVLGGCAPELDSPRYFCRDCREEFGIIETHR